MNKLKLFIAFLVLVAFSHAQYWIANNPSSSVTSTEAQAIAELADAVDGLTAAEAADIYAIAQAAGIDALALLTAAEVGYIDGATIANNLASKVAMLNAGGDLITASNVGAVEGNGVVAVEYGDGFNHVTILTLTATVVGAPAAGTNVAVGDTIYVFPAGAQLIEAMDMNMALTIGGVTTDTPELGLGSVMGAGAQVTLGAAGATMEDYFEGTAVDSCGGTAEALGIKGATAGYGTGIALNNSSDVKNLCINAADGWDAGVTGNLTASGTIAIKWTTLR
ncbi:hypothetical protein ACFL4H_00060 [Candidatus Neomarinimicrobiota bacterium]